ncbi:MAG TPA: TldD/PmbA family protein [Acidimicrobiales bacterium]
MSDDLLALAVQVADQAQSGEHIEAYVARSRDTSVRVYEGELEHLTSAQSEGIGIRVVRDGRTGFAYAGALDSEALRDALADARDNVAFGTRDEWAGVTEPDGVALPDLDLWSDALADAATDDKVDAATRLERAALALDPRIRIEAATYADQLSEVAVATSTGIRTMGRDAGCYVTIDALADQDGETQSGYGWSVGRSPDELDVERAAADAVRRTLEQLGATKPASRRVTVVFDTFVTSQLLSVLSSTLTGDAVLKGRSLFAERLGEDVASPLLTLVDDATNPAAFTASPLDAEGLATRRNVLIEGGILKQFVHSSYSGRRSGAASTGNATRAGFKGTPGCGCLALSLVPGTRSQADLIAGVDDGVFVTMVSGLHSGVNPVSGDFSTGATGRVIRRGVLAEPIREFTIASTIQRMLKDIAEVGGDIDWLPMRAAGVTLVVDDVTMSGAG